MAEKAELRKQESERSNPIELGTHIAVRSACRDLGISESLAIWSIIQYGQRNTKMHQDLEGLISRGKFEKLAEVFYNDLDDIDSVFSDFKSEMDKGRSNPSLSLKLTSGSIVKKGPKIL